MVLCFSLCLSLEHSEYFSILRRQAHRVWDTQRDKAERDTEICASSLLEYESQWVSLYNRAWGEKIPGWILNEGKLSPRVLDKTMLSSQEVCIWIPEREERVHQSVWLAIRRRGVDVCRRHQWTLQTCSWEEAEIDKAVLWNEGD